MTKHITGMRHAAQAQQSVPTPNVKAHSPWPDNRSEYPAVPNLKRLRALCQERPSRKMAVIRRSSSDILAALKAGHSLKRVCERLNEEGVSIGYRTLCTYMSRLRRESR